MAPALLRWNTLDDLLRFQIPNPDHPIGRIHGQSLAFWSERKRHWKPASLKLCHRVLRRDVPQLDDWSTAGIGTPVRQKRSVVGNRERPALSKAGKVDMLLASDWVPEPDHTKNVSKNHGFAVVGECDHHHRIRLLIESEQGITPTPLPQVSPFPSAK